MVQYLQNMKEYEDLAEKCGDKLLVIDFTASWCPPCKMISPHFDDLAEKNPDVTFVKVDVDKAADIASFFKISAMPTFKFVKNSKPIAELMGANLEGLKSMVAEHK